MTRDAIARRADAPTSAAPNAMRASALPGVLAAMSMLSGLLVLSGLAACQSDPTKGYSTQETFATDVRTVAVPIFANNTYMRDVQFELADALTKEIMASTPWRIASGAHADTILQGTITSIDLKRIAKSPTTGLAEQDVYTILMDFEWRDQRTGRTLVKRTGFSTSGLFIPTITSNDPIEFGRWNAVEAAARDIVDTMRSEW